MAKFKVTIAGTEHEVEIANAVDPSSDEFKAAYVPVAAHNFALASERKKRDGLKSPEQLIQDEEFRGQALTTWGIDPKGKGKASPEEIQQIQQGVRDKELKPLQEKLTKAEATIGQGRRSQLHSQILEAARAAHVKDEFLAKPHENAVPMIVAMMEPLFGFDEESGMHAVKDGDAAFQYSSKAERGRPYKSPAEFFSEWATSDAAKNGNFLKDVRQRVQGVQGDRPTPPGSKTVPAGDEAGFLANLGGIAKGEVQVQ